MAPWRLLVTQCASCTNSKACCTQLTMTSRPLPSISHHLFQLRRTALITARVAEIRDLIGGLGFTIGQMNRCAVWLCMQAQHLAELRLFTSIAVWIVILKQFLVAAPLLFTR